MCSNAHNPYSMPTCEVTSQHQLPRLFISKKIACTLDVRAVGVRRTYVQVYRVVGVIRLSTGNRDNRIFRSHVTS